MVIVTEQEGKGLTFTIDPRLYPEEVVYKCFYWYSADYHVDIQVTSIHQFEVSLRPKGEVLSRVLKEALVAKVKSDLIDYKTRDIVSRETRVIRELLIAKAFAHGDELDSLPPGTVTDPGGCDPTI